MELIIAAYCWQIINSHAWTALLAVKQCREAVYKLTTSFHPKRYRQIHRQNSYEPRGRRRTDRYETQGRESSSE
jgi:hypothetical protein